MKSTPLDAIQCQRVFGSSVLTHPALITVSTCGGNGYGPEIGTDSCIYNADWYRVSFELVRRETLLWVIRLDETNGPSVL